MSEYRRRKCRSTWNAGRGRTAVVGNAEAEEAEVRDVLDGEELDPLPARAALRRLQVQHALDEQRRWRGARRLTPRRCFMRAGNRHGWQRAVQLTRLD